MSKTLNKEADMNKKWPLEIEINDDLPFIHQTLSPSDFGFHNCLREHTGALRFLDLEYFGWDDPVKLTSDFLWHPGMDLSRQLKLVWIEAMKALFSRDISFLQRLNAAYPVYGLRWSLIVLNVFLYDKYTSDRNEECEKARLQKAMTLCNRVNKWIEDRSCFDYPAEVV